jgi:hypothetical protein
MKEIWKTIKDYPRYEISNMGRVKSFVLNNKGHILELSSHPKGYKQIFLWENNKSKNILIHGLVLTAFVAERPANHQCNHKNGIKSDNRAVNLEWVTGSKNIIHSFKNGLRKPYQGSRHHDAKLKESDINEIRKMATVFSEREVAKKYHVCSATIHQIVHGTIWKHVLPLTDSREAVNL